MTLSDKIRITEFHKPNEKWLPIENVREAVKELKKRFENPWSYYKKEIEKNIDEIFGDELT